MPTHWKPINILFRNDDPCALSNAEHERRFLEIFAKYKVPQVVSVIPFISEDPHNYRGTRFHELRENPEIVTLLKEYAEKGLIEIAQHGTTHQTNHLHPGREPVTGSYQGLGRTWLPYAPIFPEKGYSEFGGLERDVVRTELRRGKEFLEKIFQMPVSTFTFPWGTLDRSAVEALRDERFKTALCGEGKPFFFVKDLLTLHNAREDTFEFAKELNTGGLRGPALYHVVLHSWMLKEQDFEKLDSLLSSLAKDGRVKFVTAQELQQWPAFFHAIRMVDHTARAWAEIANRYLVNPIEISKHYHLGIKSYIKSLIKSILTIVVFEKIGLTLSWTLSAMLSVVFFMLMQIGQESFRGVFMALAACCGALFMVTTLFKLKILSACLSIWRSKKRISEDYKTIASAAFQQPDNRKKVRKYFQAYSKIKDHSEDDVKQYFQLKYMHERKPWLALNRLTEIYLRRDETFLALLCSLESLRLDPGQVRVFERAERLSKEFKHQFPGQLADDEITVSVIMPASRSSQEIKEAVQSVLDQTFEDFELIVVNDGGPHELEELVRSFQSDKIRYFRLDKPSGPGAARNLGVQKARGKYLAYLDDDDVYYPHHLETLVDLLNESRSQFGYTNMAIVRGSLEQGRFKPGRTGEVWDIPFDRGTMVTRSFMGTNTVLHEKKILKEVGLFSEKLRPGEDEELWIRCAVRYEFKHISRYTSEYRRKDDNSVKVHLLDCAFNGMLYRKYYAFSCGQIAFIKYFLAHNNPHKAHSLYAEIKKQYPDSFKTAAVLREVVQIAKRLKDKDFQKNL